MSTPVRRASTDQSSISVVRGLLERNLLERAVAVSESRWPGSGAVVRLAHEWGTLTPGDRRQRLAAIGPEDLARLRGVAELQPDLARVLDDLEARGILPPAVPDDATGAGISEPLVTEERVDAVLDLAQEQAGDLIAQVQESTGATPSEREVRDALRTLQQGPRDAMLGTTLTPLPQVLNPSFTPTDSAAQFQQLEAERREQLASQAESILDRVRQTIDQSSARLAALRIPTPPTNRADYVHRTGAERAGARRDDGAPASRSDEATIRTRREDREDLDAEAGARLIEQLRGTRVHVIDSDMERPDEAALAHAARALGLNLVPLSTELSSRELYGGLKRTGRDIGTQVGELPRALSGHNLVVLRGRLFPKFLERLDDGYCDIPGTNATVRVDPDARLIVVSE